MRFRVLGPLEIDDGAGPVALGGKPRALLALLLLHANEPVPADRIVDALWGEAVPESAAKMLHGIVSRLRKALPREVLETRPGGYVVNVETGALDLHRFEALTREGAAADEPHEAADLLREALALWRGAPLAGVREPFAHTEAARLEELRMAALEQRIEADLACGRHAELIGELEALVRRDPLRERLRGQLMLALYRAGRQPDALAGYHAYRRELDEQLGLAPSKRLRELEQRILTHDSELSPPSQPAPARIAEPRVELPAPLDSFVGRERDLRTLAEMIGRDDVRLLTLTGPGGVGKTRLALELARTAAGAFADGVRFVPLVAVSDPDQVLLAIAVALGLRQEHKTLDAVAAELRHARLLLVLDNFEHLLGAAPALAELLGRASRLTALVTSRAPLGVRGEREWEVAPLALSDDAGAESDAVRLFAERAGAARRTFQVTPAVRELCTRLDGLPLAIELAAAHTRVLSPQALLERLGSRLDLPTAGTPSDLPERQRTLRATIDWSHDLLDSPARALFARFGIFVGGATLDAVEAVCGAQLERLRALHDHSLVRLDDQERYAMLDTIRRYALERLEERGEHDTIAAAHAAFVRELAHTGGIEVRGPGEQTWSARLDAEMPNIRAAIAWLQDAGRPEDVIRIAVALWPFLWPQGHAVEGQRWLMTALEPDRNTRIDPELRRQALATAATLAWTIGGREPEAERLARAALDARPGGPDDGFAALARGVLALLAASRGELERSIRIGENVEATFRLVGDPWNALVTSILIARTQAAAGVPDRARMAANVTAARQLSRYLLAAALIDLGTTQLADGDRHAARAALVEALTIGDALGSPIARARALLALAALALADGDARRCATLLAASAGIRSGIQLALAAPEVARQNALAAAARDGLGPAAYTAASEHGATMPTRHAVAYALSRT
jgi:predicted ATPase/DNA-binding SARP family transcriptional activator